MTAANLILRLCGLATLVAVVSIDPGVETLSVAGGVIAALTGVEIVKRRGKDNH